MLVELQAEDGQEAAEDEGCEFVAVVNVTVTPAQNNRGPYKYIQ